MSKPVISKDIYFVGENDKDLDFFEGQYIVPEGMSYNSYVIVDDKIAILDTIDSRKTSEWISDVDAVLDGRQPAYLVVHHLEPDHSANIKYIADRFPECKIVCTAKAASMMPQFFDDDFSDRIIKVKEGDTLELGHHTLRFIMAPMIHWPEVMMSYEQSEKVLFSADAFGKFGYYDSDLDDWDCEARRYYFNICGKYGAQVQMLLKKAANLDITTICPLHGPVLTGDLSHYINLYDTWSKYEPETDGVFIAYCSLHGNTAKAALRLAEILKSKTDKKISTADLMRTDLAEDVEDAFRYSNMVLAAPTYDCGIMPVMGDFLSHLKAKSYQKRRVAIIENGSWAPVAAKLIKEELNQMKNIQVIDNVVTIRTTMKPETETALQALADEILS